MSDTKEKILQTALRLFARDGYEAVSVSDIAGELGITKGALYKHYANKRSIFNSIVERMYQIDAERSRRYAVPQEKYCDAPGAYDTVSVEAVRSFTMAQFQFWTEDEFAAYFRKMLTLEQYRSEEMAQLHSQCLTAGPLAYMEDIFRDMMGRGILKNSDPQTLSVEFYAPMYLLMGLPNDKKNAKLLEAHIERFIRRNTNCKEC